MSKMSTGAIILGFIALVTGLGDMLGADLPVLEILLIIVGINRAKARRGNAAQVPRTRRGAGEERTAQLLKSERRCRKVLRTC